MSRAPSTAAVVAALELAWKGIQRRHPEVPAVVFVIGAGTDRRTPGATTLGHWYPGRWTPTDAHGVRLPEVFVGGEGLARGAGPVLGTLLHEAAHGVAHVRKVRDTSRSGRYHNKVYKAIAEELGLHVAQVGAIGWSDTTPTYATAADYADELRELEQAIRASRVREDRRVLDDEGGDEDGDEGGEGGGEGGDEGGDDDDAPAPRKSRIRVVCACPTPRACYIAPGVFDVAPITCGACNAPFAIPE